MSVETYWPNFCRHAVECYLGTVSIRRPGVKSIVIDVYVYPRIVNADKPTELGVCLRFSAERNEGLFFESIVDFTSHVSLNNICRYAAPLVQGWLNPDNVAKLPVNKETCTGFAEAPQREG
jgi:hypothetical protein